MNIHMTPRNLTEDGLHKVFHKMKPHHFIQIYCNGEVRKKRKKILRAYRKHLYEKFLKDMAIFTELFTCGKPELIYDKISRDYNTSQIYKVIQQNIINFRYVEFNNEIYLFNEKQA